MLLPNVLSVMPREDLKHCKCINWSFYSFSQDYDISDGTYSSKSTLNDEFLKNFSWQYLFYPQGFCTEFFHFIWSEISV